jgi:hypothetical protein
MTNNGSQVSIVDDSTRHADSITSEHDNKVNRRVGSLCMLYLLLSLGFLSWQLFDIWVGQHTFARLVRYNLEPLKTPIFRLVFFTVVGGGIGGVINGIRSVLEWYPTFDRKYAWKYIMAPWLGGALALIAYALLNSGVSIFGGGGITDASAPRILAMFSVGILAGYGAQDVFIWLDAQVSRLFDPEKTGSVIISRVAEAEDEPEEADSEEENDMVANVETDTILALSGEEVAAASPTTIDSPHLGEITTDHPPVPVT